MGINLLLCDKKNYSINIQPIIFIALKENKTKQPFAIGIDIGGTTTKFGIVDLWRMQKKHKTLGCSTRW